MSIFDQKILRTIIAGLAFCFLMASYYIINPTRSSIFLHHIDSRYFQWVYFFSAVVTFGGVLLYNRLVSYFSRTNFIRILFAVTISLFTLFVLSFQFGIPIRNAVIASHTPNWWLLFSVDVSIRLLATFYLLFLSVYILLFTSIFWSFNHEIHSPKEAKIAYSYISLGGQIGLMLGSKFTQIFSKKIGSYNLIWFAVIGLLICWIFMELLKHCRSQIPHKIEKKLPITGVYKDFTSLLNNRYAIYIALLVILGTYTTTMCDYQYKMLMKAEIPQMDEQTSFLARNNFIMGIGNIVMTIGITPLLFSLLGPPLAICIFPVIILVISSFFLYGMSIHTAAWFAIAFSCLNYTLYQVGKEVFYVPTDKITKYKIKAFCDIFGYRLGDAVGSLSISGYFLIFSIFQSVVFIPGLSIIVILITIVWFFVLSGINKEYREKLKEISS